MDILENMPLGCKTTMRIGGNAKYYAELHSKKDAEEAIRFANENHIPLIILGSGSNTVFADTTIDALVARITAEKVVINDDEITVESGKSMASLVNEAADIGMDLSPLTGIPGTIGGAVFGNAGQGPKGCWISTFIKNVTVFTDGKWNTIPNSECEFSYRESKFKKQSTIYDVKYATPSIIWSVKLKTPLESPKDIQSKIDTLLKNRIKTQPHKKTAGSCFKAVGDTPAWKIIDKAGLRGTGIGGISISEKHANFLINNGNATFADAVKTVKLIQNSIPEEMHVEMRFIRDDGSIVF